LRRAARLALLATLAAAFTGCTKLGPDFVRPAPPPLPKELDKKADPAALRETARWWKIFGDPVLDTLIERASTQNLDLRGAGLRILQARAALGIAAGMQYPQKQTLSGSYSVGYNKGHIDAASASLDTVWEMDIWGKYARGIESAEASLYAAVASYRDILVAIEAETARHYIAYRTAQERIAYARRNIAIQERVTRMTEIQYNAGNVSELDMQQSRTQLFNTRAALPGLKMQQIAAVNALAVLLGTRLRPHPSHRRGAADPPARHQARRIPRPRRRRADRRQRGAFVPLLHPLRLDRDQRHRPQPALSQPQGVGQPRRQPRSGGGTGL